MCMAPFSRLWACCCDRRQIYQSPNSTTADIRKNRSNNTRVRIATESPRSRTSASYPAPSKRRKSSHTSQRQHTSTSSEKLRSRNYSAEDLPRKRRRPRTAEEHEERRRRKRAGERTGNGVAAAAATSTERERKHRRRRDRDAARAGGGVVVAEGGLVADKVQTNRRSSSHTIHDDSGYRTEEKMRRPSRKTSRRAAIVSTTDESPSVTATSSQAPYAPVENGILRKAGQPSRLSNEGNSSVVRVNMVEIPEFVPELSIRDFTPDGTPISRLASTKRDEALRESVVNMLDRDQSSTEEERTAHKSYSEEKRPKKPKHRSPSIEGGVRVNMLDGGPSYPGEEQVITRKRSKRRQNKGEGDAAVMVQTINGDPSYPGDEPAPRKRSKHRQNKSEGDATLRVQTANMLDNDPDYSEEHKSRKKLSRSKSTGHKERSGESSRPTRAAVIAAQATKQSGNEILRRRSTRNKPIRPEDVDMTYRDPDAESDENYVASEDTETIDDGRRTVRSASQKTRKRSSSNAAGQVSRKNSTGSPERKKSSRSSKPTGEHRKHKQPSMTAARTQALDPRGGRIEFSLGNLEMLAHEGLSQGINARPKLAHVPAFAPSTVNYRPAFVYIEDGPIPRTEAEHHLNLSNHISGKGLQSLIPASHPRLREIASTAASRSSFICRSLYLSRYAVADLTRLGLYDVIVFCDDSTSMQKEDRFDTMKTVVKRIARVSSTYNPSGIKIRFINSKNDRGFNGITTEDQVETCMDAVALGRGTALGTALFEKVVVPEIIEKARRGELQRPVLISVVTDGEPTGEHFDTLKRTILATKNELQKLSTVNGGRYGASAVAFTISRVGSSAAARRFLQNLAEDEEVRDLVYCAAENLDWALGGSQDSGMLNTWVTQLLACSVKR